MLSLADIALILIALAGAVASGWYFFSKTTEGPGGALCHGNRAFGF